VCKRDDLPWPFGFAGEFSDRPFLLRGLVVEIIRVGQRLAGLFLDDLRYAV